jgi:uncharacterized membrane protein
MYILLFFWLTLSISFIFFTLAKLSKDDEYGGVDSDIFIIFTIVSLACFIISLITWTNYKASKEMSNHHNYSECVKLNAVGGSVGVKLDSMPKAKQLCAELYPDSLNNKKSI